MHVYTLLYKRLAFCRSEELRRWLLTTESDLFRHRLETGTPADNVVHSFAFSFSFSCIFFILIVLLGRIIYIYILLRL